MARLSKAGGGKTARAKAQASQAKGRKLAEAKRRAASKPRKGRSVAELEARLERQARELDEALQQQTATADVLKVISRSSIDLATVLATLVQTVARLCRADQVYMFHLRHELWHLIADCGLSEEAREFFKTNPFTPGRGSTSGRAALERRAILIPDVLQDPEYTLSEGQANAGYRTTLGIPLLRENTLIGVYSICRTRVEPFTDKELELATSFADQAVIAIHNARLFEELQVQRREAVEALEYQTATSSILEIISRSPSDAQPVFEAIVKNAARLCEAVFSVVWRYDGELLHYVASHNFTPQVHARLLQEYPKRPDRSIAAGRAILDAAIAEIPNMLADPTYAHELALAGNWRASFAVPMLHNGVAIGAISLGKAEAVPFSERQVQLLTTFASQAVIAIENVRLFEQLRKRTDDLSESLQQQTATSEVLQVINSAPGELAPVFDAMLERAMRLCRAAFGGLWVFEGDHYVATALRGIPPDYANYLNRTTVVPGPHTAPYRFRQGERSAIQNIDLAAEEPYRTGDPQRRALVDLGGARTALQAPLVRDEVVLGVITVYRQEVSPFSEKQIDLLQNFAAQAVIAIENARLFNETKEALERQTATADILKVIASSPSDTTPVFEAIATSTKRLLGGFSCAVWRFVEGKVHLAAFTPTTPAADEALRADFPQPVENFEAFRLARNGVPFPIPDTEEIAHPPLREIARLHGFRSIIFVPLMNGSVPIGIIAPTRAEPGAFAPHHVQLLQTFADQAVIAIENTRLFNEVQERTVELTEALEQQTATAEVLGVISSSPGDLAPVFDAMLRKAMQLCKANFGVLNTYDGKTFHTAATFGLPPAYDEYRRKQPLEYGRSTAPARLLEGEPFIEITDLLDSEAYRAGEPNRRALVDIGRARSLLAVPLLKDERVFGNVMIFRQERWPFSEKQITLLQQFAAQAVIAIENTRLLRELRESTEDLSESLQQQTATSEVLQIISSSPGDLAPIFDKMLENATRVCGAGFGSMVLVDGDTLRQVAFYNAPPELAAVRTNQVRKVHPLSSIAAAVRDKRVVQIEDIRRSPAYLARAQHAIELTELGGARTIVVVPMVRDDDAIGVITVYRQEVRPFGDKQIDLLTNFARQAVIAIENARLLRELRLRTEELSRSLDDLRTAQDRLVQTEKLASLGQLTAGIAHEIKNPLNFVNNFASLSAELVDEMTDVFQNSALDEASRRKELDGIRELLKSNLEKVVQHGKRADSIVKNMLQHSREGSGEQRSADINALVEECLNLAYHGARAEKPSFAITLKHDLDPDAGALELYPQEITRALLNLLSNGFYAATKRKNEDGGAGPEPTVLAATKDLGSSVEIRIRDNGSGIPPGVRQKIFNPFFTTKPTGEGTGLGLSITHDIIVKQHGGRIDVETKVGEFTEFIIVLPRDRTAAG